MNVTSICGYLGSICLTLVYLPQVHRVYQTKGTDALSLPTIVLQTLTSVLFIVYGIGLEAYPIIIANTSSLLCSLYLGWAKCKYPKRYHIPEV